MPAAKCRSRLYLIDSPEGIIGEWLRPWLNIGWAAIDVPLIVPMKSS